MTAFQFTTALVSVGGSPAPVLFTLRKHQPKRVWYFCSAGSRDVADDIHRQLDWHPERDIIEVECFEELGPCYRALRTALPEFLRKWRVPGCEVMVDYTGGTKTMSAALVLAATELFEHFSYVGGEQREKAGLGVTVDGKERILYQSNPWSALAIREIERAADLWQDCQFDAVGRILRHTAARVPNRLRFETLATISDALAARHRLDFKQAKTLARPTLGKIPALYDGCDDLGLGALVHTLVDLCQECDKGEASPVLLRELLDNTLRTAGQHRFEDAAARLYRAMEMQAQLWLTEATTGAFINGKLKENHPLPEALKDFCQRNASGEILLSMDQAFRALDRLGDVRARAIVAELNLGKKNRWHAATEKRNTSILAHGVTPISSDGFTAMKAIASELLGFDLDREANPIPALEHGWF